MDSSETARSKWKSAAVEAETGQAPASGPQRRPQTPDEGETTAAPSTETPEVTTERVKRLLAAADAVARKGLDLPPREGVDVDLSDADSLDMAAELMTPWAQQHGGKLTPGVQASAGVGLLVLELLKDGGYEKISESIDAATQGESSETVSDLPDKADDF